MTPIEIIALIMIILAVIKLIVFLTGPKRWMTVVKAVYGVPVLTVIIALILAAVVLFYLIQELTIVQILATTAFFGLIMAIGWAMFSKDMLPCFNKILSKNVWKRSWLSWIIWIALIVWALVVMFA